MGNRNLYESDDRPSCSVCGEPATYRVSCEYLIDRGSGLETDSVKDWGCPYVCRPCALVNEANRVGERRRRDADVESTRITAW